ncbi:DUF1361 domain-containing protein [Phaeocystidibacter luteus]|uniref:DUF1361 domain-containing protein n=1 Tax=Phaeocystidibacter luteus TaxID=911197 RepID=A0A6N6RMC5_9FLAO|nr:DUF1361 domain-containing protein [Phaeocystidibacter luteus]KAB2814705.1 DUF1361 domain-containing protein [Phaeocystidibacter luteus]
MNIRNEWTAFALLSLLCFALSIARMLYTGSAGYIFLNWNLFLAGIPWFISWNMERKPWMQRRAPLVIFSMFWLLFFPNAPYILTDLFHLRHLNSAPIWYDLTMILTYAWVGILFGFKSLLKLERIYADKIGARFTKLLIPALLFITAFGVYLGRYQRWNSWDIIHQPGNLLYDVLHRVFVPWEHPQTWGMTIVFGILLNLMYYNFKHFKTASEVRSITQP